jgi:anaerobic magnesium-protoporphyrin IX monomethyl ester cyclase
LVETQDENQIGAAGLDPYSSCLAPFRNTLHMESKSRNSQVTCLLVEPAYPGYGKGFYVNYGLTLLAQLVREADMSVGMLSAQIDDLTPEEAVEKILALDPKVVGFTCMTVSFNWVARTAALLKKKAPQIHTIQGGTHLTAIPERTMDEAPGIDIGVIGEGEKIIVPLLKALIGNNKTSDIPGLIFRIGDGYQINERPPLVEDLSTLPIPAYDLLDPRSFINTTYGVLSAPILSSRGCPGKCKFCYKKTFGNRIRRRTSEHILNEIEHLIKNYGIEHFSFEDDLFTASKKSLGAFFDEMDRRKLRFEWSCWTRVDTVDSKILRSMKNHGCSLIRYGIESGSQEILDRNEKRTTLEQIRRAFDLTRNAGIMIMGCFMFGNMGETRESAQETMDLIKQLKPEMLYMSSCMPYPGTEVARWAEENGYLATSNWDEYQESGAFPVMRTDDLTAEEVQQIRQRANDILRKDLVWRLRRFINTLKHPYRFWKKLKLIFC